MKMRPSVTLTVWLGWLCVLLAAVSHSVDTQTTVYGKVGGDVILTAPAGSVTESVKQILWTEGSSKAMEWDGEGQPVDPYRQFKERGHLNTSTGDMTIRGLVQNDSNVYTLTIGANDNKNIKLTSVRLIVLYPVPVPIVTVIPCEVSTCELTCKGNTTGAEPVTYTWKSDNEVVPLSSGMQYTIHKEDSLSSNEFSCEMKNAVSQESSEPIPNPLHSPSEGGPNVSMGITVLVVLLALVVVLVAFHKWKTGTWFFEKDSMPWEADFWRKNERQTGEAPASNGTPARQQNEKAEEETPMAQA